MTSVGVRPIDRRIERIRMGGDAPRGTLAERVAAHPSWFHSIDLGGLVTPGVKSAERLALEFQQMQLPDLRGKRVLDVGAWDGWFSFACERAGARKVVSLDHYAWSIDWQAARRYALARGEQGLTLEPWDTVPGVWRPWRLPGRAGFEIARHALRSSVTPVVGDIATMRLGPLGTFDVVLFLGVLYHLQDPLGVLRRVRSLTRGLAVVETEAIAVAGHPDRPLVEFFGGTELAGDPTNWWAPTEAALHGLCRAAGFSGVRTVVGPPEEPTEAQPVLRYRLCVHATA
jgi:tRNA (mo5U34)-methyltransferase